MQYKQEVANVASYGAFRTKIECMIREYVKPRLAKDRPNVVAFTEDVGLATIATGSRGQAGRDLISHAGRGARDAKDSRPPCGAAAALFAINDAYGRQNAAYAARFPQMGPIERAFIAPTDTFARGWMQVFSDMARRYGIYIVGSNNQAPFRESSDPSEIAAFADPDLPEPPRSVFVATDDSVYNEAFIWGPRDVREEGPWPLRNVVAQNKKVPLTDLEELLQVSNGPSTGRRRYREPAALPVGGDEGAARNRDEPAGVSVRIRVRRAAAGRRPVLGHPALLHALPQQARRERRDPGRGQSWSLGRDPAGRMAAARVDGLVVAARRRSRAFSFAYNVTPFMVGNLADLVFDGQSSIAQRGKARGRGCNYVGTRRFQASDRRRTIRQPTGPTPAASASSSPSRRGSSVTEPATSCARSPRSSGSGSGDPLENDYVETALVADLPFPVDQRRPGCVR